MEEEQIVGVLKRCSICEEKTLHVEGVCQSHKILRTVRTSPARATPATRATRAPSKPARKRPWRTWISMVLVVALVVLLGAVHIVHGGNSGLHLCWKDGWTLGDTFVDLEDIKASKA